MGLLGLPVLAAAAYATSASLSAPTLWRLHWVSRKSDWSSRLEWPHPRRTHPPPLAAALCVGGPGPAVKGARKGLKPLLQQVGPCLPRSEVRLYLAPQLSTSQSVVHGVLGFPRHFQGSEESQYFSNDVKTLFISFTVLTLLMVQRQQVGKTADTHMTHSNDAKLN